MAEHIQSKYCEILANKFQTTAPVNIHRLQRCQIYADRNH